MQRSIQNDDLATQIKVFNRTLDAQGQAASIDFYDNVVAPFILHLAQQGQVPAALQALERAKRTLRIEPGSQLEGEIAQMAARLRSGNFPKKGG